MQRNQYEGTVEMDILNRCKEHISDYMEVLNRIGEDIPDDLDQLAEDLEKGK
jgi:hypothetical protein